MSSKMKWPLAAIVIIATILIFSVWAINYFALFQKNQLNDGPVVFDQEVVDSKPQSVPFTIERVVTDLKVPWSLVFTSTERWLVSEREGRIRVINNGILLQQPLLTLTDVASSDEEGLMGLALDPEYDTNHLVYACYATPGVDGLVDKIIRFEDLGSNTGQSETILDGIPAARFHAGCRLGFGPDDKLYITTGDATDKEIAQDLNSLGGKILRINPDGSIPDDNPFPNSPIWSLGHRNSQGIAWQPGTNQLFATEHGPSVFDGPAGGDEINIIQKGANYGWPIISHEQTDKRFITPLLVFTPAVAPSGAAFYTADRLPQFTNDFFFAALKGEGLIRVVLDDADPKRVVQYEKLTEVNVGRIREVVQGLDDALYFMTSNRDGRSNVLSGDDAIYRIVPVE